MKVYTRGGDEGRTGLFGGDRVSKADARVEAYGSVDEANAALGLALALDAEGTLEALPGGPSAPHAAAALAAVQEDLFRVGARLAAADPEGASRRGSLPPLEPTRVEELEAWIDALDETLTPLDAFILPGGGPLGAQLHVARTVCRRAERAVVRLLEEQPELTGTVVPLLNRLSDLLFTLARAANAGQGAPERRWVTRRDGGAGEGEVEA